MYMIGKRLKKRHNLMDDVRVSLYQQVNHFLKAVESSAAAGAGRFLGGAEPNLADLAVYGCISSMEGTRTFVDLLAHTKVVGWYDAVKEKIDQRRARLVVET